LAARGHHRRRGSRPRPDPGWDRAARADLLRRSLGDPALSGGGVIRPAPTRISVIVPVYNAAATLPLALEHLAAQDYEGDWELVLVDNRSTDASAEVCRGWLDRFGSARLVEALDDQGVSHARNVGVAASTGDFIAICDADDAAGPGGLSALAGGARGRGGRGPTGEPG